MIRTGEQLRTAWRNAVPRAGARYTLTDFHDPWFVGCSNEGWPALVRRVDNKFSDSVRAMGAVRLRLLSNADLQLPGVKELGNFAAIECQQSELIETFVVLALDLVQSIGTGAATSRAIQDRLAHWRDLLTGTEALSKEEELGLWGELEVLGRFPDLAEAVDGWQGPNREQIDFSRNSIGIEVKTSAVRRVHRLGWSQAVYGDTPYDAYLVSLHVVRDSTGQSLAEKADELLRLTPDPYALRAKFLAARFREQDAASYEGRWNLVEPPAFFVMSSVPRFSSIPEGVTDVKWRVDLTSKRTLPDKAVENLLRSFVEKK